MCFTGSTLRSGDLHPIVAGSLARHLGGLSLRLTGGSFCPLGASLGLSEISICELLGRGRLLLGSSARFTRLQLGSCLSLAGSASFLSDPLGSCFDFTDSQFDSRLRLTRLLSFAPRCLRIGSGSGPGGNCFVSGFLSRRRSLFGTSPGCNSLRRGSTCDNEPSVGLLELTLDLSGRCFAPAGFAFRGYSCYSCLVDSSASISRHLAEPRYL